MDKLILTKTLEGLSLTDKSVIIARQSKKIKDCSGGEIKKALAYILILLGETKWIKENTGSMALDIIIKSIYRAFGNVRIEEFTLAFDMAVDQKFSVNLSLYNRTFNSDFVAKVILAYLEYRKPSLKTENLLLNQREVEKTPDEKRKIAMDGIDEAFKKYKETGIMPGICAWMYIELENYGAINQSAELKLEIYANAKVKLEDNLKRDKTKADEFGIKDIVKRLQNIGEDAELKTIARELALQHYWDEIINK